MRNWVRVAERERDPEQQSLQAERERLKALEHENRQLKQAAVELATLDWVHWYNQHRLLEPLGYLPPVEYEQAYHQRQSQLVYLAGRYANSSSLASGEPGAAQLNDMPPRLAAFMPTLLVPLRQ